MFGAGTNVYVVPCRTCRTPLKSLSPIGIAVECYECREGAKLRNYVEHYCLGACGTLMRHPLRSFNVPFWCDKCAQKEKQMSNKEIKKDWLRVQVGACSGTSFATKEAAVASAKERIANYPTERYVIYEAVESVQVKAQPVVVETLV